MGQMLGKREVRLTPFFFSPSNWKNGVVMHLDEEDSKKNEYLLGSQIVSFRHKFEICN